MPSYSYHLKIELYPVPDPTTTTGGEDFGKGREVWIPSATSNIFEDLPAHPRKRTGSSRPRGSARDFARGAACNDRSWTSRASDVIDCGGTQSPADDSDDAQNGPDIASIPQRRWRERSKSIPAPAFTAGIGPRTAVRDWRFGPLSIESFDLARWDAEKGVSGQTGPMDGAEAEHPTPAVSLGPNLGGPGQATKARYIPLETKNTEIGWGIVHLYRESDEAYAFNNSRRGDAGQGEDGGASGSGSGSTSGEDGTILCIPSVPSYLSPSDFLGFVGEKWRGDVSHYRMVMTSRMNRYMVLMKFRDRRRAEEWRAEFDGKVFNSMEAEICHVTFIKSITFETPSQPSSKHNIRDGGADQFSKSSGVVNSLKPFPPPTPNLIELPTCTVCLERMDDTTGLMTILCQHVFHCTCLQTWKGSGCPVCRATNPSLAAAASGSGQHTYDPDNPYTQPFGSGVANLCSVCDCTSDLWICLICGNVGCGRYKGGHAKDHWKETAHSFSLELETQYVWDYAGDMWVHRLIREKGDGKVVELPSNRDNNDRFSRRLRSANGREEEGGSQEDADVVPRAKLDRIGMEYTHLLTSQLESQRVYFEEMVNKAADKAAKAAAAAEAASAQAQQALRELSALKEERRALKEEAIPSLERDVARERARGAKSAELARSLGKALQEEKKVSEGLMARIAHVNGELETVRRDMEALRLENEELKETNRDLTMFISGQEKLKELENEGKIEQGELEEGKVSLPEEKKTKGKGKGKAKR